MRSWLLQSENRVLSYRNCANIFNITFPSFSLIIRCNFFSVNTIPFYSCRYFVTLTNHSKISVLSVTLPSLQYFSNIYHLLGSVFERSLERMVIDSRLLEWTMKWRMSVFRMERGPAQNIASRRAAAAYLPTCDRLPRQLFPPAPLARRRGPSLDRCRYAATCATPTRALHSRWNFVLMGI